MSPNFQNSTKMTRSTRYLISIHFDSILKQNKQGSHNLYTLIVSEPEKWLSLKLRKSDKINLSIKSKSHAPCQTMTKKTPKTTTTKNKQTLVQFQKGWHRNVGGVADVPTTYTYWQYLSLKKNDYVQNAEKVIKTNLRFISKSQAYLQTMTKHLFSFKKIAIKW